MMRARGAESEFTNTLKEAAHLSGLGKNIEALALLDDAMTKAAGDWQIGPFAQIATIISRSMGSLDLMRSYCEQQLALDPENALALYNLADCLALQGQPELAKQYAAKSYETSKAKGGDEGRRICRRIETRFPDIKWDT